MTTLAQQLLDMVQSLEPGLGTSSDSLAALLRTQAASVIQKDGAQAVPPLDAPPAIADAITKGAQQAKTLTASGVRVWLEEQELTSSESATTQAFETFGPFVERTGRLLRFVACHTRAFLSVDLRSPSAPIPLDQWLLIPAASTAAFADNRTWNLAAGTVWIRSRFLVPGAAGFVGLRIAAGTLKFDRPVELAGNRILAPNLTVWSLSVEPEKPPPPAAAGSDVDSVTLVLPSRLDVHSNTTPAVTGSISLSGFGSDLHCTPSGTPVVEGQHISFPLKTLHPKWSIAGNRSRTVQFSGDSRPDSPRWALPVSTAAFDQLAEAPDAGSLLVSLAAPIAATLADEQNASVRCFVNTLTVNGLVLELESLQCDSKGRYDFGLWDKTTSAVRFAGKPLAHFVFRSERGGLDAAFVFGGKWNNKWDLPRRADGRPFAFDGEAQFFGLLSNSAGFWIACSATAVPPPTELAAVALENLFLTVRPPAKLFFLASFEKTPQLTAGTALLFFDVSLAIPTLPDPYAANLGNPRSDVFASNALRIEIQWDNSQSPALAVHLDSRVRFPEPRFPAPVDPEETTLEQLFWRRLAAQQEFLYLIDMSSRDHLFGVALESPSVDMPQIVGNRFSVPLQHVRLLMQPQVQWEPVFIVPNPDVAGLKPEYAHSNQNGGPTLVGVNAVTLVPTLPGLVSREIVHAVESNHPGAALFSLPFGLRAVAFLDSRALVEGHLRPGTDTSLHEPLFDGLRSARQFRLAARNTKPTEDPARIMPGMMQQTKNFEQPPGAPIPLDAANNGSGLLSVVPNALLDALNTQFHNGVPLHQVDLSGYGLSTFSEWRADDVTIGFCKAQFEVLNGRTAYEVLQFRSVLYECGAPVVRTVILERKNSGAVLRVDTGWVAIGPGTFVLPKEKGGPDAPPCESGAVRSFQNIRRIRIVSDALLTLSAIAAVQPVLFDGDAEIDEVAGGGPGGLVPFFDRPGYVQVRPTDGPPAKATGPLVTAEVAELFRQVGLVASPIDCVIRAGKTLATQLSSIVSDAALDDANQWGFAVAVLGTHRLPHAAHWNVVKVNPTTGEVTPVDQHRGAPLVRNQANPYRFREPSDARRTNPAMEYGFLMTTDTSRVLFPQPKLDPAQAGRILFDRPALLADPYSLVQSVGPFPRTNFALPLDTVPAFHVSPDDVWQIEKPDFKIVGSPDPGLLTGGEWAVNRQYPSDIIKLSIDSGVTKAFDVGVDSSELTLNLPAPLGDIFKIVGKYSSAADGLPKLEKPDLKFIGPLQDLTDILNSLSEMTGLPFDFDVSITGSGDTVPSFIVHLHLLFRVGDGPDGRVDIGVGKFYGQFLIDGALQASLTGVSDALLFMEFRGDIQQGILPPLLYAGGLFRFSIEIRATGAPIIQLSLGVVASIGGDLIPGLIAVEVTVSYGYTLIPETLQPGVLLGLEARAKLLGGLVGFSFSVEAMARIKRLALGDGNVTIWAQIHIAASVQVAIFIEENVDFETQFEQTIPLALAVLAAGGGGLFAAASEL